MTRRRTHREFAQQTGRTATRLFNLARRMVILAHDATEWLIEGFRDEADHVETRQAEVFPGIGILARPPTDGAAEAVVIAEGGSANHLLIVGTRDHKTAQAIIAQVGLAAGETIVYNALRVIKLTKDGDVLIGDPGGNFQAVALAGHTHEAPEIVGQAQYRNGTGARTGPPNKVSQHFKVT